MPKKESGQDIALAVRAQAATDKDSNDPTLKQQVMYIGPTMLRPVLLQHRSVYTGGIPRTVGELASKDEDLSGCFVPLSEAGKALRELEGYPGTVAGDHSRRFLSVRKRYLEEAKK